MKKRVLIILFLTIILIILTLIFNFYNLKKYDKFILSNESVFENTVVYEEKITDLQRKYANEDVKAILHIENTDFTTAVLQGDDNDYYLNHLPDKSYNINGSVFFDYRNNIEKDYKLLIFGHSSESYDLPIEIIENFQDYSYYEEHKYIYLDTKESQKKYVVVAAYVETSDFDYMQIEFSSAKAREEHYQKLKSKSFYETGIELNKDDHILIMQTCSTMKEYRKYPKKYFLLIAKQINE